MKVQVRKMSIFQTLHFLQGRGAVVDTERPHETTRDHMCGVAVRRTAALAIA